MRYYKDTLKEQAKMEAEMDQQEKAKTDAVFDDPRLQEAYERGFQRGLDFAKLEESEEVAESEAEAPVGDIEEPPVNEELSDPMYRDSLENGVELVSEEDEEVSEEVKEEPIEEASHAVFDMPKEAEGQIRAAKLFVTMTDKFISGWGGAKGMEAKLIVACDDEKEAKQIVKAAKKRGDMEGIKVVKNFPNYKGKQASYRHFDQLGGIWKE